MALMVVSAALTSTGSSPASAAIQPQAGDLSLIWANDGADKVVRDEISSQTTADLTNAAWNGSSVTLSGARNETVNFNLVLEAASNTASGVDVEFDQLVGPGGFTISSAPSSDDLFDYRNRDIELFYVRYLQIRGIGGLSYGLYDEQHVPEKLRLPADGNGNFGGNWGDRPYADRFFPEIAVPLELESPFTINQGENQSVWADVYIPNDAPAGNYTGTVTVKESAVVTSEIPVQLQVRDFALPNENASKTMIFASLQDITQRYTGESYPNPGTPAAVKAEAVLAEHYKMAKRHRLSLFGGEDNSSNFSLLNDRPSDYIIPFLDGSGFTASNGYRGPGEGLGTGFYSIGTYGSWPSWSGGETEAAMRTHTDAWETWFRQNLPTVERVLYLTDEPPEDQYPDLERLAGWVENNPGPGSALTTFATLPFADAVAATPSLDIAATWIGYAETGRFTAAYDQLKAAGKDVYLYNAIRPGSGSLATEDDGTSVRELPWGQYKMGVDRWFYWQSTYYNDFQGGRGQTDVFNNAQTFGGPTTFNPTFGQQGFNATNGDGVLFYPGADTIFPAESYDVDGPIASLRMKHWRRGIQDVEYLTLARAIDPAATDAIVQRMVPRVLWEVDVTDPNDPTYSLGPVSWSNDADVWEQARADLATIIEENAPPPPPPASEVDVTWELADGSLVIDGNSTATDANQYGVAFGDELTIAGGTVSFDAATGAGSTYVGLQVSDNTVPDAAAIDQAIAFNGAGNAEVRQLGAYVTETTYAEGDRFAISVDDGTVTYLKNGAVFYSASQPAAAMRLKVQHGGVSALTNARILANEQVEPPPPPPPPPGDPVLSVVSQTVTETDANQTISLTFELDKPATRTLRARYVTAADTAVRGQDYVHRGGRVTFRTGQSQQIVSMVVKGDTVSESTESFTIGLSAPTAGLVLGDDGIITIEDDDDAPPPDPVVTAVSQTVVETNRNQVLPVTLTLDAVPTKRVTVSYATVAGTASANLDYRPRVARIAFQAGQTSKTVNITIRGGSIPEPDEQFQIVLSNPRGLTLGSDATITIVDND